jgi:hypothetical protein
MYRSMNSFNLETRWKWVVSFTPRQSYLPPPVKEHPGAHWAPELAWTRWRREKKSLHCPCWESNPGSQAHSLVTILTELSYDKLMITPPGRKGESRENMTQTFPQHPLQREFCGPVHKNGQQSAKCCQFTGRVNIDSELLITCVVQASN